MELEAYQSRWSLTNPVQLAETPTSALYRVRRADGGAAVLKILTELGRADEAAGAPWLDYIDGDGAVNLLAHDDGAHLLEYLGGATLVPMVAAGDDAGATAIVVDVVKKLHGPKNKSVPVGLPTLRERFRALFDRRDDTSFFSRGAQLAETLLNSQSEIRSLHGDLHHLNILHGPRGWCAIDPKGILGDPHYELAALFGNPHGMPHLTDDPARACAMVAQCAQALGLDSGRILAFAAAQSALSAAWNLMDGLDPAHDFALGRVLFGLIDAPAAHKAGRNYGRSL
ncbi:MAG: 3'-kinase [Rhodospirillales bacterium]|nr:3'-kinase [Alphaproteobacteria bacterium]MCB9986522.1 3'-kinase [Rhodospirillales bacterium]USO06941.1 MAG: 3'-kinase [Rhodospirillales bacterium]